WGWVVRGWLMSGGWGEGGVRGLRGRDRGQPPGVRRALLASSGMAALFGLGAMLLIKLPPQSLLWGFLVPLAVIVLKAGSLLLLGTRGWRRFVGHPRGVIGFLVALGLVAWLAVPRGAGAHAHAAHGAH